MRRELGLAGYSAGSAPGLQWATGVLSVQANAVLRRLLQRAWAPVNAANSAPIRPARLRDGWKATT